MEILHLIKIMKWMKRRITHMCCALEFPNTRNIKEGGAGATHNKK
jgi:hypothetical protein